MRATGERSAGISRLPMPRILLDAEISRTIYRRELEMMPPCLPPNRAQPPRPGRKALHYLARCSRAVYPAVSFPLISELIRRVAARALPVPSRWRAQAILVFPFAARRPSGMPVIADLSSRVVVPSLKRAANVAARCGQSHPIYQLPEDSPRV